MALNYDAISALTKIKYMPRIVDQIFKSTPLLSLLRERQVTYDGGYKIVEPLAYGELSGIKSYSLYDTVTYDQNIPISAAEYRPKNIVAPFTISKDEELQNRGENEVLNLINAKMEILRNSLQKQLTLQILGDGTGNDGKDIDGFAAMLDDTNVYGGIDRSQYPWWRVNVFRNGGEPRPLTTKLMLTAYLACTDGQDKPTVIVCDKKTWMKYYELVEGKVQLVTQPMKKLIGLGFQTLEFMGIPVIWDDHIDPDVHGGGNGIMYFINTRYVKLRPHKRANFTVTPMRQADNQIAFKQEILWTGNLTLNHARRQAVIKDIDISDV